MSSQFSTKKSIFYGVMVTLSLLVLAELIARAVEISKPQSALVREINSSSQTESFRIFVYGGSTAQGQPTVEFGFVTQLEFWLREIHPEKALEIYNFAGAGRTSAYARRKVAESISFDPDLLIILSGHNEFLYRNTENLPNKIVASFALTRSLSRKLNRLQENFAPDDMTQPNYEAYVRDSSLFQQKVEAYDENLAEIVEMARDFKTPVLLITAPSNIADWPPAYKHSANNIHAEEQASWVREVEKLLGDGSSDAAIANIQEKLIRLPNEPLLVYLLAKAYVVAGEYDQARVFFTRAKDLDPIPWRALTEFNESVRKLAELDGVFLVDAEKSFTQKADHGLVGFPLVVDNCHPTPLGNAIIVRDILAAMQRQNLYLEGDIERTDADSSLTHFFTQTTTPAIRRQLELAQAITTAKYSMKTPFFNNKTSRMYLERALAIDASRWEIWVNLATLTLLEDGIDEGRRQLRKAIQLRGAPIDENDRGHAPYLKESLEHSGVNLAELQR